jgi:hypothetical protein
MRGGDIFVSSCLKKYFIKTKLSGFFDVVNKIEDIILAILVIGMIATILLQIIGRVVGHPFPWIILIAIFLCVFIIFPQIIEVPVALIFGT